MKEIEYEICKCIKRYNQIYNNDPTSTDLSKMVYRTSSVVRYHISKLEKKGILKKQKNKTIKLLVNNVE